MRRLWLIVGGVTLLVCPMFWQFFDMMRLTDMATLGNEPDLAPGVSQWMSRQMTIVWPLRIVGVVMLILGIILPKKRKSREL